jgi:hypothetical protein
MAVTRLPSVLSPEVTIGSDERKPSPSVSYHQIDHDSGSADQRETTPDDGTWAPNDLWHGGSLAHFAGENCVCFQHRQALRSSFFLPA